MSARLPDDGKYGVKPERGARVCVFPRVAHHTGIRDFMGDGKYGVKPDRRGRVCRPKREGSPEER